MELTIFDCNNYVRKRYEVDKSGMPLRQLMVEAISSGPNLYVFDGVNSKRLRREIFPGYKDGRQAAPDNFYHQLNFYKELIMHTANVVIEVPGYEADDVIGYITRKDTNRYRIESTDRDFVQLWREGVTQPGVNLKGVLPEEVRLYKSLVNDKSDNIKGLPKFGHGAWEKLTADHKQAWKNYFDTGVTPASLEELGLNTPVHQKNFQDPETQKLLQAYWKITGFFDVPADLIAKHTKIGTKDWPAIDRKLKDTFQ